MMRQLLIVLLSLGAIMGVGAQEIYTPTTPPTTTSATYTVQAVFIDMVSLTITVKIADNNGAQTYAVYAANGLSINGVVKAATPTGATLLHTLNTANFTSTSLVKQVYARLQTDGVIVAGTVSGSAQ